MTLLITILQAAHCRSTHQFFVLDALPHVSTSRGDHLRSLLLHYHDAYLTGSKDPDKVFRDFRNHVLHVSDNSWGGAAVTAEKWYRKLLEKMEQQQWEDVAYTAGVLSHYFTDPLMPLHTAQSERESIYHRAMEWSVTKSYAKIRDHWRSGPNAKEFELSTGVSWLSQSIHKGATISHNYYEELLDRYDLERGSKRPTEGFDSRSIDIFARLFGMAIVGWAQVLDRAANESVASVPKFSIGMKTIGAALQMPAAWVTRRVESAEERDAVRAIFAEYAETGKVVDQLPLEVKSVQQEREADREIGKLGRRTDVSHHQDRPTSKVAPLTVEMISPAPAQPFVAQETEPDPQQTRSSTPTRGKVNENQTPVLKPERNHANHPNEDDENDPKKEIREKFDAKIDEMAKDRDSTVARLRRSRAAIDRLKAARERRDEMRRAGQVHAPTGVERERRKLARPTTPKANRNTQRSNVSLFPNTQKSTLSLQDDLVDAPSIGPKTAKRFQAIGITTVRGFLAADPDEMSDALETRWITSKLIRDWQAQAKLVCAIPSLCGYKSQLLVAVDCRTTQQLAIQDPKVLNGAITEFAETSQGQRILRSSSVPSSDDIAIWVDEAIQCVNHQAAA